MSQADTERELMQAQKQLDDAETQVDRCRKLRDAYLGQLVNQWGVNMTDAARLIGVTRQAVAFAIGVAPRTKRAAAK